MNTPRTSVPCDFSITNHGSVVLLHCHTDTVREHLLERVGPEAQWGGPDGRSLVVEPRYVGDIVLALFKEDFTAPLTLARFTPESVNPPSPRGPRRLSRIQ